ncbi:MAG: 23S rRNA (adenine(2503)-C(2))-methyltransferase RlmN [Bacteroidales bacterium]|nr:23S rRNA (adenine(2503)-C(2))-methyltransferase RlmN [Bacteroidales bacterium]
MTPLFGKTLSELNEVATSVGLPKFAAKQMADWLYKKNVASIDEMTNLPKVGRQRLAEQYEVGRKNPIDVATSIDGTKKYLFAVNGANGRQGYIETAFIPDDDRATLCVSSQVGCKMACQFCMTGRQGFGANLTSGEILNQMASIAERETLTNIVYMGMGEPMDNLEEVIKSVEILTSAWGYGWSPRRITVSTIGVTPALVQFIERCEAHVAISLHNAISEQRLELMPSEKAFPIAKTIEALRKYDWTGQRRLSFEYTMFEGKNDTPSHVSAITKLLAGIRCRINIINFNQIPDSDLKGSSRQKMERFRDSLNDKGFTATIRNSKGGDIFAACGLLSTKEQMKGISK